MTIEQDCFADCDDSRSLNLDDIDCFLASFLSECP